ncbi:phosphatidylethanolamine-binding protein [Flagelloscypha sp. PMI_526]|nr:phosphatidylethanolamine-binding protein [Flagelloscypha sp. PMI_526]
MLALAVAVPLAFAALSAAQDATAIAAEKAHLTQAGIEPGCIPSFDPQATLTVNFDGTVGSIQPGQKITVADTQPTPKLSLTPANSSVQFNGDYTVAMVDCDIVGADTSQVTRHWLVNNAKVASNAVTTDNVNEITKYGAPLPAEGSGSHRYVLLVYAQPSGFTPPADPPTNAGIAKFSLSDYVKAANLGSPIAANYIQVEQGTATQSVSQTQSVVSSTLAAGASSSASSTGSKSGSASTPSSSTKPNSASSLVACAVPAAVSVVFGLFMTLF